MTDDTDSPSGVDTRDRRERCKLCGGVNRVGFHVPDEIWRAVVPEAVRHRVVCLGCFTALADAQLVAWDRDIRFWPVSLVSSRVP